MCYGMGCEWEDSLGECRAPRWVVRCPYEEVDEIGGEESGEEKEEEDEE